MPLRIGDLEAEGAKQQECWEVRILQEVCDLGTLRTAIKEKHLCKDNSCHPHARGSLGSSSTKTLLSHKSSYTISQTASQSEASYTETPPPLDFWPEDTMPEMYEGTSGTTINTEMKQVRSAARAEGCGRGKFRGCK